MDSEMSPGKSSLSSFHCGLYLLTIIDVTCCASGYEIRKMLGRRLVRFSIAGIPSTRMLLKTSRTFLWSQP